MKLEKFKKYGKRNKKIICSVIGIILIICGVLLLKSFAFFESKYDFDVIKGRIPPFNVSDVTLAFTIDGVKNNDVFPVKNSEYAVKSVTCSNGVTAEWDNDLWGLVNINSNGQKKINCNIDFGKFLYEVVNIGDYVSYTPSSTSYTIASSMTGYSSDQTINPSELDLWRVIKKNTDGTIEMISEYVSSTLVYFYARTGYNNHINVLNTIAKQYETERVTSGSKYPNYRSEDGDLVITAIGNLKAQTKEQKGTTPLAYRSYLAGDIRWTSCGSTCYGAGIYYVTEDDTIIHEDLYWNWNKGELVGSYGYSVRPYVIVKERKFVISGAGSSTSPYKIN